MKLSKGQTGSRGRATHLLKQGEKLKRKRRRLQEYRANFDIMRINLNESEEEKNESNMLM